MSLFAELKRRKVFKVGAAYLVVAWLLIQVTATVAPQLQMPEWAPRFVTMLLLLGFPLTLVLTWVFDLTPEGVKLDTTPTGNKRMIAVAAGLAALVLGWYFFAPARHPPNDFPAPPQSLTRSGTATPAAAAETANAAQTPAKKSIAVLPFTDLSPGHDQEYFSDGMAEELLNALAKVKDLKVAGRTSSFSFKGKNEDLRVIGQALAVANVLEGSVRKQGNKVRITAQLIQASDGFHLWSETYDGDMTDVFELQERIARAITEQLKLVLESGQQQRLVPVATANPEAYALYLKATTVFNQRNGPKFSEAIHDLNDAIRLDPGYARAHARLAALYVVATNYTALDAYEAAAIAEREARRAIELEPTLAEAHAVLGLVQDNLRESVAGRAATEHAFELDPRDVTVSFWLAINLIDTGYTAQGVARLDRTLEIDPLYPNGLMWRAFHYLGSGAKDRARPMAQQAVEAGLTAGDHVLGELAHAEGHDAEAIEHFARGFRGFMSAFPEGSSKVLAEGLYSDAAAHDRALAMIDTYLATRPKVVSGGAPWALLMLGEPARALAVAQPAPTGNDPLFFRTLWSPTGAAARKLPQFPEFARKVGFTDVWEKYGPPDLCERKAQSEYVCH